MSLNHARSLLFVPATSSHLLAKAAQRGADALIVDLEDAVPLARKQEARGMAAQAIAQLAGKAPLLLRVNAAPEMYLLDIADVAFDNVTAVMLPKVESAQQVQALADALAQRAPQRSTPVPIVALVETARGVMDALAITRAHTSLCALGFGAEDFAAEMGVAPEPVSLAWPAQQVTTAARAAGLPCWGLAGSIAEIEDMAAFARLVRDARAIGFTGTVCIHPRQVAVANAGFGPTAQELDWAQRVVEADAEARAKGLGAVQLDGRMIDLPIVERARRWLAAATRG